MVPTKDIAKIVSVPSRLKQFVQYLALLVITIALGVGICFLVAINNPERRDVALGSEIFRLEVANNDAERIRGLSDRNTIAQNAGMLLDFERLGDWTIWMKDMHFNIDILWLDEAGKIVFIKTDASPSSYPEVFRAPKPSRYVIELPTGTVERLALKINNIINLR
jgi:uncharacterized membrane protein (UPF0127 family)